MGWLEDYPRDYYSKYEKIQVNDHRNWYEVYRLPGQVYAIAEPQQLQEVNAFLAIGEESALLVDTGMGIFPIKPLVEELLGDMFTGGEGSDSRGADAGRFGADAGCFGEGSGSRGVDACSSNKGAIYTVNTHCHFDHVGSNKAFEPIHVLDTGFAREAAGRGLTHGDVAGELTEECFQFGFPEGFDPEEYKVEPYEVIPVKDGHVFDLGGRKIRVIGTGGHCQDHLCLFDETYHILFTGDLAYHGALFANFNNPLFGKSDLSRYTEVMEELAETLPADTRCYVSHNDFVLTMEEFREIADAFRQVVEREAAGDYEDASEVGTGFDFGEEGRKPHIYDFGRFSIYTEGE